MHVIASAQLYVAPMAERFTGDCNGIAAGAVQTAVHTALCLYSLAGNWSSQAHVFSRSQQQSHVKRFADELVLCCH